MLCSEEILSHQNKYPKCDRLNVSAKSSCWTLIPTVWYLKVGLLGYDGMGMKLSWNIPYKREPRELPRPTSKDDTGEKWLSMNRKRLSPDPESATTLILDLPVPRTARKKSAVYKPPSPWYFCHSAHGYLDTLCSDSIFSLTFTALTAFHGALIYNSELITR